MDWQNYGTTKNAADLFGSSWMDGGQNTAIREALFKQLGIPLDAYTAGTANEGGVTPSSLTPEARKILEGLQAQYVNNGVGENMGGVRLSGEDAQAETAFSPEKDGFLMKNMPLLMAALAGAGAGGFLPGADAGASLLGQGAATSAAPSSLLGEGWTLGGAGGSVGGSVGGGASLLDAGWTLGAGGGASNPFSAGLFAGGSGSPSLFSGSSLLSGAKDLVPLAGAVAGAASSKDQTQTTNRDPWGPAQDFLKANIASAQDLQKKYQDNPFSDGQKTAYGNIANIINGANQAAPAFWNGMAANATGANNYDRNNPRRSLIGTNAAMPGYSMGLLNPFGG